MKRCLGLLAAAAAVLFATACSEPFVTNTARSAVEEMLICTVVERGISKAEFGRYQGKVVKLDCANLAPQVDKDLIIAYLKLHLSNSGVIISESDAQKPEYIIQVSCGVLATDIDRFMIGTPALPIPVSQTSLSIVIPEIPLFRRIVRSGHARFFFNVLDVATAKPIESFVGLNAEAKYVNWTVLLIPFKTHNVPLEDEARVSHEVILPYEE